MDTDDLIALYWQVRDAHDACISLMKHCASNDDDIGDAFYTGKADAYEQILNALKTFLPST